MKPIRQSIQSKLNLKKSQLVLSPLMVAVLMTAYHGNSSQAADAKNIIRNGGFDEGKHSWVGFDSIQTENNNKFASVSLKSDATVKIKQAITLKGVKTLEISAAYKTSTDFKGIGFYFRLLREDNLDASIAGKLTQVKATNEWQDFRYTFEDIDPKGQYYLEIVIHPGGGKLFFDNIKGVSVQSP